MEVVVVGFVGLGLGAEWVDLAGCRELTAILAGVPLAAVPLLLDRYFRSRSSFLLVVAKDVWVDRGEES